MIFYFVVARRQRISADEAISLSRGGMKTLLDTPPKNLKPRSLPTTPSARGFGLLQSLAMTEWMFFMFWGKVRKGVFVPVLMMAIATAIKDRVMASQ